MSSMDMLSMIMQFGGFMIIAILAIVIAVYVITSLAIVRVLRICGYDKVWMAWIPYAQYWALGEVACGVKPALDIFGLVDIPKIVYQLWWVVTLAVSWLLPSTPAFWINLIIQIVMLGTVYKNIYARVEGKDPSECNVIGYVSGWLTIISIVKFYCYDKNVRA